MAKTEFEAVLAGWVRLVSRGQIGLHDERSLLLSKPKLLKALSESLGRDHDVADFIANRLLVPVEWDEASRCLPIARGNGTFRAAPSPLEIQGRSRSD